MFVTVGSVAVMLVMAAAPADDLELTRISYDSCMVENAIEHLDRKTSEADFANFIIEACSLEAEKYRNAIIRYEQAEGASSEEAEEYADEEIKQAEYDFVEAYAEHLGSGTRPES